MPEGSHNQPADEADQERKPRLDATYAIYSKLISGESPDNPIVQGFEARITAKSEKLQTWHLKLCNPEFFFSKNSTITSIDPTKDGAGAFVYRPIVAKDRDYYLFARMQAWPESGRGGSGRTFPFCTMLVFEGDWVPELIPYAAQRLFEDHPGAPCISRLPYKGMDNRSALPDFSIDVDDLPKAQKLDTAPIRFHDGAWISHASMPEELTHVQLASHFAHVLKESKIGTEGWFLPFAIGISQSVKANGAPFFMVLHDEQDEAPAPPPKPFDFTPENPAAAAIRSPDPRSPYFEISWTNAIGFKTATPRERNNRIASRAVRLEDSKSEDPAAPNPEFAPETEFDRQEAAARAASDSFAKSTAPQNETAQAAGHLEGPDRKTFLNARDVDPSLDFNEPVDPAAPDKPSQVQATTSPISTSPVLRPSTLRGFGMSVQPSASAFPAWAKYNLNIDALDIPLKSLSDNFQDDIINKAIAATRQLEGRASLLEKNYESLLTNGCEKTIVESVADLIPAIVTFAIFDQPKRLEQPLNSILKHKKLEYLNVSAGGFGGIAAYFLHQSFERIGFERIGEWMDNCCEAIENVRMQRTVQNSGKSTMTIKPKEKELQELVNDLVSRKPHASRRFDPDVDDDHRMVFQEFKYAIETTRNRQAKYFASPIE